MAELIKNSEIIVTVEGYNSSGSGVARIDGYVIFVSNSLRGEVCKVKILKTLKNVAYAKPIEIIKPSPHRITPKCPSFGKCGGCDFLHMDYTEELELKRLRVEDALRRVGGFDVTVPAVIGSQLTEGYRNKAIYAVGYDYAKNRPAAGFYRERSHDIIPAERCIIQAEVSHRAASAVTRWMEFYKVPCYNEETGKGAIRHIFCRHACTPNSAQIVIVSAIEKMGHIDELIDAIIKDCPETSSIVLNVNKSRRNTVLAGSFNALWGDGFIVDELCGQNFRLSPRSFYQINHAQAERLYEKALSLAALTKKDTALDLYCGTGTITLLLAKHAGRVIGAEINPDAVSDARENAILGGVLNAEFICADASKAAQTLKNADITPTAVVVDPPRKGLAPDVIGTISQMSPKRVVYISCNPATLARDLKLFDSLGYPLESITPFDMFPRCAHVECVVLLSKV